MEVTHKQIYDRLVEVETKVDSIDQNTKGLVEAMKALDGAFKVLGWVWETVSKQATEDALAANIALQKNPVQAQGVPWATE